MGDALTCGGIAELQGAGVEHEALARVGVAVKDIAEDRAAEAGRARRGGVDAELVGAAGDRTEFDACAVDLAGEDPPARSGWAALLEVHDLVGPAVHVEAHRQADLAGFPDRKSTRLNSSHLGISYAA